MYLKAYSIAEKPYVLFSSVCETLEELVALGLDDDPLIVQREDIVVQFGVCTKKIDGGVLVDRTEIEMDAFELEYLPFVAITEQRQRGESLNAKTFTYDTTDFPMNEAARLNYLAVNHLGSNAKLLAADGSEYTLLSGDIAAFMTAYFTALKNETQPPIV